MFPQVILFDLDGTLIETSEIVVDAYYEAMTKLGYNNPSREVIASLAGKSTQGTAEGMGAKSEEYDFIDSYFWDYFGKYAERTNYVPLFDGVAITIKTLHDRGITLGIVTSNESKSARKLMEKAGLDQYFGSYIGREDLPERKPSPKPIELAFHQLGVNPKQAWFIGDTIYDVNAAHAAKITSIAIPQEFTLEQVIRAEPEFLLNSFNDILPLLEQLNSV